MSVTPLRHGGAGTSMPRSLADEISRPRLVQRLQDRWNLSLVVLEAAGGFGKTTLIAQAVRENVIAPVGVDVYVACRRSDVEDTVLAGRILEGLGAVVPALVDDPAAVVLGAIGRLAPTPVAVILDDLHHLREGDSASALIATLIRELPLNGHLVLSGRTLPPLPFARLIAADNIVRIGREELAFTAIESAQLAGYHDLPVERAIPSGGWPALTRLSLTTDTTGTIDYLLEEVVAGLSSIECDAVVLACVARRARVSWLGSILRPDVRDTRWLEQLFARLPLVSVHDGLVQPHDLWSDALPRLASPERLADCTKLAVEEAIAGGRADDGIDTALGFGAWASALTAMLAFMAGGSVLPTKARVDNWLTSLPIDFHDAPAALLLRGMQARLRDDFATGLALAKSALDQIRRSDDPSAIASAAFEVGYSAWLQSDIATVVEVYQIGLGLAAQGHEFLRPLLSLVEAVAADLRGDASAAVDLLGTIDVELLAVPIRIVVVGELVSKLQITGDTGRAVQLATELFEAIADRRVEFLMVVAHWLDLNPAPIVGLGSLDGFRSSDRDQTDFRAAVYGALVHSSLGIPMPQLPPFGTSRTRETFFRAIGEAASLITAGDEAAAGQLLAKTLGEVGLDDPLIRGELRRHPVIPYVLVPACRPVIDDADLGATQAARRGVARQLVATRLEGGSKARALPDAATLLCSLPLRWCAELLAGSHFHDPSGAEETARLIDRWTDGRLAALVVANTEFGAIARVRPHPAVPERTVRIRVCGPLSLTVERAASDASSDSETTAIGRLRVRQLLGVLLLEDRVPIARVLSELWPDLTERQSRNNLGVNLRLVRELIDASERPATDSAVQRSPVHLRLARHAHISCDLWDIVDSLDAADRCRRRRDAHGAITSLTSALDLWTGPILDDLAYTDSFGHAVESIHRQLSVAGCEVAEWLYANGQLEQALHRAEQVLRHDPFEERAHTVRIAALLDAPTGERDVIRSAIDDCRDALRQLGVDAGPSLAMTIRRADDGA